VDDIVSNKVSVWFDNLSKETLQQKFNESRADELKKLLINETRLSSLLSTKENALENAEKRLEEAFLANYPLNMLNTLTDSIDNLKTAINNIKDQIQEIENNITNEKAILEKQNKLSEQLLDFKYLYNHATQAEKKLLIRSIVDKIIITDYDNINIEFKY
jgi:Mg2+ and Co2+ transporter CorA